MRKTELWRTARLVSNLIDRESGCTVSLQDQRPYKGSGYALSVHPQCERKLLFNHPIPILAWIEEHQDILQEVDRYIGAWSSDGLIYLDVATIVQDKSLAMFLARSADQTAIYDLANHQDIRVPGSASPVIEKES